MPKISIIVPVYNSEKYLKQCINSICNQTLEDIEIIFINDASTDSSLEILKYYEKQDKRIKVINLEENQGPGKVRNLGIKNANGKYIGFVDSDDYIFPDMYSDLYQGAIENQTVIARCNNKKIIFNVDFRKIIGRSASNTGGSKIIVPMNNQEFLQQENVACWNKIYEHDFISNFSFPEDIAFEDYPMVIKMLGSADRIFHLDKINYAYRIRPNSITTSYDRNFDLSVLDIFECNDQIQKYYQEKGLLTVFNKTLTNIYILHAISKVPPILTISMPLAKKKELINSFINLMEIEYGNWQENEFYQYKKNNSVRFGPSMKIVEEYFLDDKLRQETSSEKVKEKIKTIIK